jgi:hypothetical protein
MADAGDPNSSANQALDVITQSIADGQTNAAWGNADTTEEIAEVFNAVDAVKNMDAARFTEETESAPARADSPDGGIDPTRDDLPAGEEPAGEQAEEPSAEDTPSDNTGGGDN